MTPKDTKLLMMVLFFALRSNALAGTWYVNGVSGSDGNNCLSSTAACKTIGHAISLALSGDSIRVAAANYVENLTITINLGILGSGASTTIIDGGGVNTVVTISNTNAHVTLSNLTVRNGLAPSIGGGFPPGPTSSGGGINNSGMLTLINSTVSGNWAPIPCVHSFLFCEVRLGTALGGGIYNSGAMTISNSIISGNQAGSYCNGSSRHPCSAFGGGIYNRGTLMMIKNSTLTANSADTACSTTLSCRVGVGGAFYAFGGTLTLNNSTVSGNSA